MHLLHKCIAILLAGIVTQAWAEKITVFAAASMTNVLQQIGEQYQKQHPEDQIIFSFAGSSTLAKQIAQDAPADLFVSADQKWLDYVVEKQPEKNKKSKVLVENALVLITPKDSPQPVTAIEKINLKALIGESYLAVGDDNVPVGRYAKKALMSLQMWSAVEGRLAKAKDVRAVLAYVERGELPAGIVYATDARISDKSKVVAVFPKESYGRIVYPVATLSDKPTAQRLFDFLSSEQARKTFEQAGFITLQ